LGRGCRETVARDTKAGGQSAEAHQRPPPGDLILNFRQIAARNIPQTVKFAFATPINNVEGNLLRGCPPQGPSVMQVGFTR
jgi:hypothetical protein